MAGLKFTAQQLREVLTYSAEDGAFVWNVKPKKMKAVAGSVAGRLDPNGYVRINLFGRNCLAHRLAWLYTHDVWPDDQIDHINGDKADNRLSNLRLASFAINNQNIRTARSHSRTGVLGVRQEGHVFTARLKMAGKSVHLGCFKTPDAAHAAYLEAKRKHHAGCTL